MYFVYFSQKMLEKNLISEVSRYVDKPNTKSSCSSKLVKVLIRWFSSAGCMPRSSESGETSNKFKTLPKKKNYLWLFMKFLLSEFTNICFTLGAC